MQDILLGRCPGSHYVVPQPHCHTAAHDVSNDHSLKVDSCLGIPPAVNLSAVRIAPSVGAGAGAFQRA